MQPLNQQKYDQQLVSSSTAKRNKRRENRTNSQGLRNFRVDWSRTEYLRRAVIGYSWAKETQIMAAPEKDLGTRNSTASRKRRGSMIKTTEQDVYDIILQFPYSNTPMMWRLQILCKLDRHNTRSLRIAFQNSSIQVIMDVNWGLHVLTLIKDK